MNELLHISVESLRNAVLITGLVVVMMMMIELINIESHGRLFRRLKGSRIGQIVLSAFLGAIPGCMGGFASVSLYTHRMISFGALVAMMIASFGDEAFVMLAMIPRETIWIMAALMVIAVVSGYIVDIVHEKIHKNRCDKHDHTDCGDQMRCNDAFEVHEHHIGGKEAKGKRSFTFRRAMLLAGLGIFIIALATGNLSHSHEHPHIETHEHQHEHTEACEHQHEHTEAHEHTHHHGEAKIGSINLLDEEWMNVLFAVMSTILLIVLIFASDHFIDEHIWNHIVRKHLPVIFGWTLGVLLLIGAGIHFLDIDSWVRWLGESNARTYAFTAVMIVIATLVGILPESGPHMIFVTLYASGILPLPVLLASCISQDGHSSIPLLAESKISFLKAKAVNCIVALIVGFTSMIIL